MEFRKPNPKTSRMVYIAVVVALTLTAVIIGVTAAFSRSKKPEETTLPPSTTAAPQTTAKPSTPEEPKETLPIFVYPIAGSVSKGHDPATLVFSNTMGDYRVHQGIDISASLGDAVCAAAEGSVKEVWVDPMMGNCVSIEHSGGAVTVYKNLADNVAEGIEAGKKVSAGQKLGEVGESAMVELADEAHLHFEMTIGGVAVDPMDYLKDAGRSASFTEDTRYEL